MHWLIFSGQESDLAKNFVKGFKDKVGPETLVVLNGIAQLDDYLRLSLRNITHAVMILSSAEDLNELEKHRDQIRTWHMILGMIGPERIPLPFKVHRFRPCYVAFLPEEICKVMSVIKRMIKYRSSLY
jgi:hypothetical protein